MIFHTEQPVWLEAVTMAAYGLHIGGGTLGFASGIIAVSVEKGSRLHRLAGNIFVASMLAMASFAIVLATLIPNEMVNILIGIFALYFILTSWMTVHRKQGTAGLFEKFSAIVAIILWAPFAILSFQLLTGMAPMIKSPVPFKGPVLVALYLFTLLLGIAAISDVRLVLAGGITGAARIARHLWRMCIAFTMAAGSFFTNALPHALPGIYRVTLWSFVPQILLLGLLIFWVIRVRFTSWYKDETAAPFI
jgi:uncharacterized membrane protein